MNAIEYIRIRKCHPSLITRMVVRERLLSFLYRDGVIGDEDMDELSLQTLTNTAKVQKLLRMLQRTQCDENKSPFRSLLRALQENEQQGFLAVELQTCNISADDVELYKADLKPFLKPGQSLDDLARQIRALPIHQLEDRRELSGSRRTWAGSLEPDGGTASNRHQQPNAGAHHRSKSSSDASVQYPSVRSSRASSASAKVEFHLEEDWRPGDDVDDEGFEEGRSDLQSSWESGLGATAAQPGKNRSSVSGESATPVKSLRKSMQFGQPRQQRSLSSYQDEDLYEVPVARGVSESPKYDHIDLKRAPSPSPVQDNPIYDDTPTIVHQQDPGTSREGGSSERLYENIPPTRAAASKDVRMRKPMAQAKHQKRTSLKCPMIRSVTWKLQETWRTSLTALDSTSCVTGDGNVIVYGQNSKKENKIAVHDRKGKKLLSWDPVSQSVEGLNAIVVPSGSQRLLAVVSTQKENQIDLYDIATGRFVRYCSYKELDPGMMCTGARGQILVVDRSKDPWRIAILDTTTPDWPVDKLLESGIRQIWGICYAEVSNKEIVFASSYLAKCLVAIDAQTGQTIWKMATPDWGPFNICKSVKGCLFVTNIEKQCSEVYVFDFNGTFVKTLCQNKVKGIVDVHCLSNDKDTFLVLGHLESSKRSISIFQLDIN